MAIDAKQIKELRDLTQSGMLDCKKALAASDGNMDKAIEWLRKKGLSKANKKSGNIATEGLVKIFVDEQHKTASIVEINCETDFACKSDKFKDFADATIQHIHTNQPLDEAKLNTSKINHQDFATFLAEASGFIGEKLSVRRFKNFNRKDDNYIVNSYLHHNGSVGVIIAATCDDTAKKDNFLDFIKDLSMHAAAMNPEYINPEDVPQELLDKESEIAKENLLKEGKPENIIEKILIGKLNKFKNEVALLGQQFAKDDKKTVKQALEETCKSAGAKLKIIDYIRFKVGEGITKKTQDFAQEVAEQIAGAKA